MSRLTGRRPEHELIYGRIKEKILFGEFAPGQPLTIHGLADAVGSGVTPVREAIRRLTTEGALEALENRRVAVPYMTRSRLEQIETIRLAIEPELAEMGARNADSDITSKLEDFDAKVNRAIEQGNIRDYLEANYNFHFALYRATSAEVYLRYTEALWLQVGPSLRVVCGRYGTSNLKDQHYEATTALRKGDIATVRDAFRGDIEQGMEFIRRTIVD